mgnify:CR=1 FL=1
MTLPGENVSYSCRSLHRQWHGDLMGAVTQARHADERHAADRLSRIQVALLALVPALSDYESFLPLPPLPKAIGKALSEISVDSLYYLVGGEDGGVQRIFQRMTDQQAVLTREVSVLLNGASIVPMIYKGGELRHQLLGGRAVSNSTDIDVLVRASELERARQVLRAAGFVHAEYDPNTGSLLELTEDRVANHEARHRELYPLCRLVPFALDAREAQIVRGSEFTPLFVYGDQGLFLEVIDLHHALFRNMSVDALFDRAVPSVHASAITLSRTDHLWTSCLRFYLESSAAHVDPKQRDLAYIAALLFRGGIDWPVLTELVATADLRPALFYTLRLMGRLGIGEVPVWVLDALHPRRGSHFLDFGCRATRALGLVEGMSSGLRVLSR